MTLRAAKKERAMRRDHGEELEDSDPVADDDGLSTDTMSDTVDNSGQQLTTVDVEPIPTALLDSSIRLRAAMAASAHALMATTTPTQSAAVVEEDTASVLSCGSTLPGVEGEIVPLPSVSVMVGDRTVVIVEVEPRVDVPEGEVQAGPAAVLVTQADSQLVS